MRFIVEVHLRVFFGNSANLCFLNQIIPLFYFAYYLMNDIFENFDVL